MAIPKAPVKRIMKEEGAERVSAEAVDALVDYLETDADAIARKAIDYAKLAKRQTVKAEDIALAIGRPETSESTTENPHNLLEVVQKVLDAAAEGKGFEEIIKSFMKLEKKE